MLHLVNKITFEVSCADEAMAFEANRNFSQYCQYGMPEVIDELCTKYSKEHEWVQVEKLEIDLGRIDPGDLMNSLQTNLYSEFEKEISMQLQSLSEEQKIASKEHSLLELLTWFLHKGLLPWWAEGSGLDVDEICEEILEKQRKAFQQFLLINRSNEKIWKRVSKQFSQSMRKKIVHLFDDLVYAEQAILNYRDKITNKDRVVDEDDLNIGLLYQKILHKAPLLLNNSDDMKKEIAERVYSEMIAERLKEGYPKKNDGNDIEDHLKQKKEIVQKELVEEDIDRILVKHAGIVLIASFLKTFFSRLDLLMDNEWKTEDSLHQAIHLLRYIATGELLTPEYDLGFEKLVCGINPSEPIAREVMISENEKLEAQELLLSVIEHWSALKNTSIEGLRQTFIKRDGIVVRKDDGWVLRVERKTEDILMESLPWGFSTIILPWNHYIIYVEW